MSITPEDEFQRWKNNKLLALKYHRTICMLLAGHSVRDVAEALGVSQKTIQRFFNDAEFNDSFRYSIGITFKAALATSALYANRAVDLLIEIAEDKDQSTKYRLRAIELLLQFNIRTNNHLISENEQVNNSSDQLQILNNYNSIHALLTQQTSLQLPPVQNPDMKNLWRQIFPNQPYPEDDNNMRDWFDNPENPL